MREPETIRPASAKELVRLQIPSNPRYVSLARDMVYRLCRQHGFTAGGAFDLKLISGEAINNIIMHAYQKKEDRPIYIEVLFHPEYAELHFRDLGIQRPIGPDSARDLSDYRERGLGVYLIRKLSDYHFYDQNRKIGTLLVIKKRFS